MKSLRVIMVILFAAALFSCRAIGDLLHDGDVVAEVGSHKLYLSELEEYIPKGLSPEDSTALASQYIRGWASGQLYLAMASEQLSKSEMDVSRELEEYRLSLLKYRYEQRYVNERLDTNVTVQEVEKYYESHKDLFMLEAPLFKVRFVDIMQDSPNYETIRKSLSSTDYEDIALLDSLAYSSALRYIDSSERWMDALSLAREFGTDYGTMLSKLSGSTIEIKEERGDIKLAYVFDIRSAGTLAPIEFSENRIKDIIVNNRKHTILSTLEQDLLDDALAKKQFIIYSGK